MSLRLLFLIRSLGLGGAERQMVTLAAGLGARGHRVAVATFYAGGALAPELDAAGVRRIPLDKAGRWDTAGFALRLRRAVAAERPDVLHTYMPPANVAGALLRPFAPPLRLVWGLRAARVDFDRYGRFARLVDRAEARLSRRADLVIVNSEAGRRHAAGRGFPAGRLRVVPNGIDTARFAPRPEAAAAVRAAWGLGPHDEVVGIAARLDPIKDHETFLRAFQRLAAERPRARAVLLGDGPAPVRAGLERLAGELGIADRLTWVPFQSDPAPLYAAFDVACLASRGESFPNALAEAMACGVPCAATDAGDAADILGDAGATAPPGDPEALARALAAVLDRRRADPGLGRAARARIVERFSVEALVERTEAILAALVDPGRASGS